MASDRDDLVKTFEQLRTLANKMEFTVYEERKVTLKKLLTAIKNNIDNLTQAVAQDFGHRSEHETKLLEIIPVLEAIKFFLKHLKKWMEIKSQAVAIWFKFARARIMPQPLGVVGIVVPWNYPIQLTLMPLIAAIAAGNRVMLKLSDLTPHTNAQIRKLLQQVFSEKEVVVVEGDVEIAKAFVALPFDHLLFTGSSATGEKIMAAASANLTPVTLELGGKSPVIIAADYPLQMAVGRILTGKMFNAGQTCIAPDYVFVAEGAESLFVEAAQRFMQQHYPDCINNPDFTAIINEQNFLRLLDLSKDAVERGAKLISLVAAHQTAKEYWCWNEKNLSQANLKFVPSLLLNVPSEARVLQEEIFGPILPILSYKNIKQAVQYINERSHPLALYIFSEHTEQIDELLKKTISGGVTVNDTLLHAGQENLPFGGIGNSGMGQYHGKAGFDTFTHYKSVFMQTHYNSFSLLRPPFKKLANMLINFMLGW